MINGFSVSEQAALHFTYNNNNNGGLKTEHNNNNNNTNNNNGMLKIQAATNGGGQVEMELEEHNLKWFNLSADAKERKQQPEAISESAFKKNQITSNLKSIQTIATIIKSTPEMPQQRTEDQENAFRRIEDVHNYAKLQDFCSDIDDDEDDDEDVDDEDVDDEGAETETHFNNLKITRIQREDTEDPVDVVTVQHQECEQIEGEQEYTRCRAQQQKQQDQSLALSSTNEHDNTSDIITPEHHARRPMNAFLIFCKRHRAIVKERYKTLENRAITKILGDWWAALDDQEKQCFTDLAQQNKDAFFNANPNFKWYKLPAPPLRTLNTRPSNAMSVNFKEHEGEDVASGTASSSNYFQLADENQMGELSSLLQGQQDKEDALQQALSETSQFFSAHMPPNTNQNRRKRTSLNPETSPSNSSEEDTLAPIKKMKSTRSCKGKIYQELMNSGQIAAITKKNKRNTSGGAQAPHLEDHEKPSQHLRSASESSSSGFDLEEKIKELPALSLDIYLQRKRSTKKKKKFTSTKKSRNSHSSSGSGGNEGGIHQANDVNENASGGGAAGGVRRLTAPAAAAAAAAVGSQKRKARKESITRRDVSAIEQEVASILPLTINGCYYFNHTEAVKTPPALDNSSSFTSSSPLSSASSSSQVGATMGSNAYDVTSSTSDLLILAEVAANRTEHHHQQESSFATGL
ncbi:uncharacterized protein bbx [Drosophila tropicalis]|uniref:uncharacterized protein bbx n=1 Tax=Drosophila tropicalis TaxID=46794 RepID=UPI0035ABF437